MDTTSIKMSRLRYYDGIKGLLCYFIMLGHYWHIYYGIQGESLLKNSFLDAINSWRWGNHVFTATFWMYAFLIISGYLISFSKVRNLKMLVEKSVKRFLRLYLPILGAGAVIYIIQQTVHFHTNETKAYFINPWFQQYYNESFSIIEILKDSVRTMFIPSCDFNPPFWAISSIFLSSLMMYACLYIDHIAKRKIHIILLLFLFATIIKDNEIVLACLSGFALGYYINLQKKSKTNLLIAMVIIAVLFGITFICMRKRIAPKTFDKIMVYTLIYCFVLICFEYSTVLQKLFSNRLFLFLGKISFGVYALHWPIICSIGMLCLNTFIHIEWNAVLVYFISLLVSIATTTVTAFLYHISVEKYSMRLLKRIQF